MAEKEVYKLIAETKRRRADNQNYRKGQFQSKVKQERLALRMYINSMLCAIGKAAKGSECEDGYFLEKLEKTCDRLGFNLVKKEG